MKNQRILTYCANPECQWPIYEGDEVWRIGEQLYCHAECMVEELRRMGDVSK